MTGRDHEVLTDADEAMIHALHDKPTRAAIVVTGGASLLISRLLCVPGASQTVLEAHVPYASSGLSDYLGQRPESSCSHATALAMSVRAHDRGCRLAQDCPVEDIVGLAATCSLASDRPKRGPHRAHIAIQTAATTASVHLDLEKDVRSRAEEEDLVARLALDLLAEAAHVTQRVAVPLGAGDVCTRNRTTASPELADVWNRRSEVAWALPAGTWSRTLDAPPVGLLCGSFAPRHKGHEQLREAAEQILSGPVYYELTATNADKPALDFETLERRRAAFTDHPLAITAAATFEQKSRLFPGTTFVVGHDTAVRIVDPRFYANDPARRDQALSTIASHDCRFLVAGRLDGNTFLDLDAISLPPAHETLFEGIPAEDFRCDISSTAIRHASARNDTG